MAQESRLGPHLFCCTREDGGISLVQQGETNVTTKYIIDQTHLLATPGFTRTVYTRQEDGQWCASKYVEGRAAVHCYVNAGAVTAHVAAARKADFVCQVHEE
jgi:hypothetical protein